MYVKVQEERLDIHTAHKLKKEFVCRLQRQGNENIVLDIDSCSYCDASGLGVIQAIKSMCKKQAGMLLVTGINTYIEKLIKICMLDLEWSIAKDKEVEEILLRRRTEKGLAGKCA